ncbi:25633_t:CDS:2, partial [Gigaspora rosea]
TITRARKIDLNTEVFSVHVVDGRNRIIPPLPKGYFGNFTFRACPKMLVSQLINGSPSTIALQVRKANTDVNNSRVRTIIDLLEQQTDKSLIRPNMLFYEKSVMINNVSKLQKHYLLDFGDGTPIKLRLNREADLNDGISMILYDEDG